MRLEVGLLINGVIARIVDGTVGTVVGSPVKVGALVGMEEGVSELDNGFPTMVGVFPFTGALVGMEVGIREGAREGIAEGFLPVGVGALVGIEADTSEGTDDMGTAVVIVLGALAGMEECISIKGTDDVGIAVGALVGMEEGSTTEGTDVGIEEEGEIVLLMGVGAIVGNEEGSNEGTEDGGIEKFATAVKVGAIVGIDMGISVETGALVDIDVGISVGTGALVDIDEGVSEGTNDVGIEVEIIVALLVGNGVGTVVTIGAVVAVVGFGEG